MTTSAQYPSRLAERFQVRLSDGLRDRIRDAAKHSGRSMNAEMLHRLETSFDPARELAPAITSFLEQRIEQEVSARLRAIASQIGAAS